MRLLPALLYGLILTSTAVAMAASSTQIVENLAARESAEGRREFVIGATLGADQVLVIRSTRWIGGRKVLQFEDVCSALGAAEQRIVFREKSAGYWILDDPAAEQHVRGVALRVVRLKPSVFEVTLEPAKSLPAEARATRFYRFRWEVSVERWSDVRQRHPEWPETRPEGTASWRTLLFAADLSAGF